MELEYIYRENELDPDFIKQRRLRTIKKATVTFTEALGARLAAAGDMIASGIKEELELTYADSKYGTNLRAQRDQAYRQARVHAIASKYGLHA